MFHMSNTLPHSSQRTLVWSMCLVNLRGLWPDLCFYHSLLCNSFNSNIAEITDKKLLEFHAHCKVTSHTLELLTFNKIKLTCRCQKNSKLFCICRIVIPSYQIKQRNKLFIEYLQRSSHRQKHAGVILHIFLLTLRKNSVHCVSPFEFDFLLFKFLSFRIFIVISLPYPHSFCLHNRLVAW